MLFHQCIQGHFYQVHDKFCIAHETSYDCENFTGMGVNLKQHFIYYLLTYQIPRYTIQAVSICSDEDG